MKLAKINFIDVEIFYLLVDISFLLQEYYQKITEKKSKEKSLP